MCSSFEINSRLNIHTCCACLEIKSDEFVTLKENCDLSQLYEFCVGISVTCKDVPQLLCNKCIKIIKEFAHFKKQCHASYELWRSCFNEGKNGKENCTPVEIKEENDDVLNESHVLNNENFHDAPSKTSNDDNDFREKLTTKKETCCAKNYKEIEKIDLNNVKITYVQENDDSSEKEGFIKVVECSKCNKQYSVISEKIKCLIKHMTQTCYKHVNVNKLVIIKKLKPITSTAENTPTELFCGLCEFSSTSREDIKNHLNEHWNHNDLRCKLCTYAGKDLAELMGHRSVHQPYEFYSKLENRLCHICDKRCVTSLVLQFHYRSVHLNKIGGLCSVCRKTFKRYTPWRNHERLHKGDKYICDLCGRKYLFRNQIKAHLADHSDIRSSICDVCGKGFKRAYQLKEHLNTVHVTQPVKCSHCGKIFKCPANLTEHLKYISKSRDYQCEVCSKRFPSAFTLKCHAFWHTGERPYACESCGAQYKSKQQLKIHMRKHTGQRPYRCQQCEKCFSSRAQLKRHGSVHTGDRPYKCSACSRSFHYKKRLQLHSAAKHSRVKLESEARVA